MKKTIAVAVLVLSGLVAVPAQGAGLSPELVMFSSDMVVAGEVLGEAKTEEFKELKVAGIEQVISGTFSVVEIKPTQTIRDASATPTDKEKDKAAKPPEKITVIAVMPNRFALRFGLDQGAALTKGAKVLLAMRATDKANQYYLPTGRDYRQEATEESIKQTAKAADPANWPWGKKVDGLQLALLMPKTIETQMGGAAPPAGQKPKLNLSIQCGLAIRNTTDKAVALNLYRWDECVSVQAADEKGNVEKSVIYRPVSAGVEVEKAQFGAQFTVTLKPGQAMLIGPSEAAPMGFDLPASLDFGKWKFQAAYESKRDDRGAESVPLFKGKLEAAPVEVQVEQAQNSRFPPPP